MSEATGKRTQWITTPDRIAYPLSVVPPAGEAAPAATAVCGPRVDLRTGQTLAAREILTGSGDAAAPVSAAIRLDDALVAALPEDAAARFDAMRQLELGRALGVPCIGSVSTLAELQALIELDCDLADGPLLDAAGAESADPDHLQSRNARLVALAAACITR